MARGTVFEYQDASGKKRRVRSIKDVPRDRLNTVLVIGGEESAPAAPGSLGGRLPSIPLPDPFRQLPGEAAIALVLGLVFLKSRNFLVRTLIGAVIGFWAFFIGYQKFMDSKWSKTEGYTLEDRAARGTAPGAPDPQGR